MRRNKPPARLGGGPISLPPYCNTLTTLRSLYGESWGNYLDQSEGGLAWINNLRFIRAKLDQVQIGFNVNPGTVDDHLTELFGKGRTCGKHGLEELFRDDTIYLKKGNGEYWSIIQFDGGNTDLLRKMHSVVESIPSLSRGGNCPTKSISLVELSFDVPFPGLAYEQVEMILRYFANHLVPKNPRARFRFKSSDKFMKAKDGATNGKLTVYYHSLDINEEGPPKSWVSKTKGYPKKVGGVWHIRLEVTLRRQAVKKYLGRSCDLLVLADTVAQQDWRDYFHFELIDYDGFCDRALELARKLPMGRQIVFYKLRREGKDQPAVEQNYHMREISRYLKSMKLGGLERKTADFRRRIPL